MKLTRIDSKKLNSKKIKESSKNIKESSKNIKKSSKNIMIPNNMSLFNFYRRIIKKKSGDELKYNIKKYISLINESKSINDMYNLFILLIYLRNNNPYEKKIYYHILKELILDYQFVSTVIISSYPPNYGILINFIDIYRECMINYYILDRFKLLLNLVEVIDNQIEIDNKYNNYIEINKSFILETENISNNYDFIKYIKCNISEIELKNIKSMLIVTKEGLFK